VLITEEMSDVSVYKVEADLFCATDEVGDELYQLFTMLSNQKRTRLKGLSTISKEGVGFRQRNTEGARSIQACFRTHISRTERSITLYRALLKLIVKPESREMIREIIEQEKTALASLKELQSRLIAASGPGSK